MRVFIAIDINDQIRAGLGHLQKELVSKAGIGKSDVKWVSPDNIHLTLKFLGEIKDEQVVDVCNIAKDVADRHKVLSCRWNRSAVSAAKVPELYGSA